MNLHDLAKRLGGELGRNGFVLCAGPGHSPKDRSLSVWLDHDGKLRIYSFAGDDWTLCMDDVRERLGLPSWEPGRKEAPAFHASRRPCDDRDEASRIALVRRLWREAEDPRATPVMNYLDHRGLPPLSDDQLPVFGFHRNCPFSGERVPALLARFSPTEDDPGLDAEPTAIFRIRLDRYDGDRRKLALGPSRGQVVKLCPDISLGGVGITEGVEKGLALAASGWRPIWITCGTATMRTFPLLPWMEALTVFADRDEPGRDAALAAVARWHDAGREARILQPPLGHKDWDQWFRGGGQS
ncbi:MULTISPECIES: toprim domain-containing protein [Rhizobium]|uniref:toprim domain-containing protein n=1 Tax=Rhizobium TaxID=379 RepID=UPI001030DCA3|nr:MULTISPECIES: toprim domain-containing protein [Rhizobium]MBY5483253.1 virulence-associated protein E [Rhizobium leguminosarum]NEI28473.1 virulence-associated protein E [Rhizobium ruizarguesonis]NKL64996.1 virulence-associated protein E [Rhizobium leguminosarum bv. viciae]TBA81190.1 virulence-associated protein E [Rhizobium ruizarguesonis]TBZ64512.1 virulence-associated protein E [Rhizobium leguminosarum bv. viciae]